MMNGVDPWEVYQSFFTGGTKTKTDSSAGRVNCPTVSSGDPVYNRSTEDYFWTSSPYDNYRSITYSSHPRPHPNYCHMTWLGQGTFPELEKYTVRRITGIVHEAGDLPMIEETRYCGAFMPGAYNIAKITASESEWNDRLGNALATIASYGAPKMMNLPQAIIELKDIPRTYRDLGNMLKWARGLPRRKFNVLKRSTLRQVAKGWLSYAFGIAPTAGDVTSFCRQIPKRLELSGRLVVYRKGTPIRAAFQVGGSGDIPRYPSTSRITSGTIWYNRGDNPNICLADAWAGANSTRTASKGTTDTAQWPFGSHLGFQVESRVGVAFGRVANDIDYGRIQTIFDDIIANAPLALTVWELIPFSFIVDWFADVSNWMRNANRIRVAEDLGLTLEDGVWLGERRANTFYYPKLSQTVTDSYSVSRVVGNTTYVDAFASSVKSVTHVPVSSEGTYHRDKYSDMRLPRISIRGFGDQGLFQAGTSLALCLA